MKWGIALVAVAAVLAAPATAAAPTLSGLQRQITALKSQVVRLQANDKIHTTNDQTTRDWSTCQHAQSLDLSNSIWHVLNVDLAYQGFPAQPDLPRYDDAGACQRIGQTRIR